MLPLEGIRVLDLSRLLAGPFCTTILGDLGADIIKVESLPDGDLYRNAPPFHHGESVSFLAINRNKRSLGIDFRKEGGLDLVREIADVADVIVENFKPGTMDNNRSALCETAPADLIQLRVASFPRCRL